MKQIIIPREEFQKGFVKQHTRKGKQVGPYFTKRQKKISTVRHTKKTRMDISGSDAKSKIKELEAKKQHHNEHIDIAESLKKKVKEHKSEGNTHLKIGKTKHDVNKLISDLKDHIQHHSNEKQSHHNHIEKIKDRHETEAKHWEKKAVVVNKEKIIPKKEPIYKIEKIGNSDRYNFYYPDKGEQVKLEDRPLGQINMFFKMGRATEPIPSQFEGREHVKSITQYAPKPKRETVKKDEPLVKRISFKTTDRTDTFHKYKNTAIEYTLTESITKSHFKELMRLTHMYDYKTKSGFISEGNKEKFLALSDKMSRSNLKRAKTSHQKATDKLKQRRYEPKYTFEDYVEDQLDQHIALMSDEAKAEAYKDFKAGQ